MMHRVGHETKNVFYSGSYFGFGIVGVFLFLGQRFVSVAFFVDMALAFFLLKILFYLFAPVGAVCMELFICFID